MINPLHNNQSTEKDFEPKEGEQRSLCSNNRSVGSPSLGCNTDAEDESFAGLADFFDLLARFDYEDQLKERAINREQTTPITKEFND
jgi:hypothetical protein